MLSLKMFFLNRKSLLYIEQQPPTIKLENNLKDRMKSCKRVPLPRNSYVNEDVFNKKNTTTIWNKSQQQDSDFIQQQWQQHQQQHEDEVVVE